MHQLSVRFIFRATNIRDTKREKYFYRLFFRQHFPINRSLRYELTPDSLARGKAGRRANIFCKVETATRPWLSSYKLFRVPIDQTKSRLSTERAWISKAYWAWDVSGALSLDLSRDLQIERIATERKRAKRCLSVSGTVGKGKREKGR